jgi:hypothetical protein
MLLQIEVLKSINNIAFTIISFWLFFPVGIASIR